MSTHKASAEVHVGRFEASHTKFAKARAALEPDALWTINVDTQDATDKVLAAYPRIRSLRGAIEATLPTFELSNIDKLETLAEALVYAQRVYLAASVPVDSLPEIVARAIPLRDRLLSDATALAQRNLLDARKLAQLKGGNGYYNVCMDIGVLASMFRDHADAIKGKSAVEESELVEADRIFEQITLAHAERSKQPARVAAATDDRQRAYTLLFSTYDQVRRAISYVRWNEEDVDKFAPSLFAGRGGRGAPKQDPAATGGSADGNAQTPPATGPAPTTTPATGANGANAANGTSTTPVAVVTPTTPGHPGNSPFSNG